MAENTFKGANQAFANTGIHFILGQIINFRKQITSRTEFKAQSGWGDPLNQYMQEELQRLRKTLARITYNIENKTKDQLEKEAGDTAIQLKDEFTALSLTSDQVLMPPVKIRPLTWNLDGSDVDIPQLSATEFLNQDARSFVTGLDEFFVQLTRLDSRHAAETITKHESAMMLAYLNSLYTLTVDRGGELQKSDISVGTLPSQDPETFLGGGNTKGSK